MHFQTDQQSLGRFARFIDPRVLNRPKAKRVILGLAVLFLLVGIAISLDSNPEVLSNLDWRPLLVLVLVAVPVTIMFEEPAGGAMDTLQNPRDSSVAFGAAQHVAVRRTLGL